MSEQHIELSLIKYELPSKMLLHCVTHLAAHTNWDDKCSCGIIDGDVGIERGEMNSLSIYMHMGIRESRESN
jgi:hypothetical protein